MGIQHAGLGRRKFLAASAAAAGEMLMRHGGPGGRARPGPRGVPAQRSGSGGTAFTSTGITGTALTGATVNPQPYAAGSWLQGAQIFDSCVGMPLATTAQKIYLPEGQFYSGPLPSHLTGLASAGCEFIFCVHPSASTDQSAELAAFLQTLNHYGLVYQVALVNEWNNSHASFTPQAYLEYWSHYAPVVQAAGVKVSSLVCASSGKAQYAKIQTGFPSDPVPDAYWIDYYATAYHWKVRLDTPGGLLDQAEEAGVPVGIAEFGWGAGGGRYVTISTWNDYIAYLAGLAPRLTLGCLYWGSEGLDIVTGPDDQKIPGIRQLAAAVQQASRARAAQSRLTGRPPARALMSAAIR